MKADLQQNEDCSNAWKEPYPTPQLSLTNTLTDFQSYSHFPTSLSNQNYFNNHLIIQNLFTNSNLNSNSIPTPNLNSKEFSSFNFNFSFPQQNYTTSDSFQISNSEEIHLEYDMGIGGQETNNENAFHTQGEVQGQYTSHSSHSIHSNHPSQIPTQSYPTSNLNREFSYFQTNQEKNTDFFESKSQFLQLIAFIFSGIVGTACKHENLSNDISMHDPTSSASAELKGHSNLQKTRGSSFFNPLMPSITLENYLQRIVKHTHVSDECLILSLIYVDQFVRRNPDFQICNHTIHRLMLTSIIIAIKFHSDFYRYNSYYAAVGGISKEEMNFLELEFLYMMNFSLRVSGEEYEKYKREIFSFLPKIQKYPSSIHMNPAYNSDVTMHSIHSNHAIHVEQQPIHTIHHQHSHQHPMYTQQTMQISSNLPSHFENEFSANLPQVPLPQLQQTQHSQYMHHPTQLLQTGYNQNSQPFNNYNQNSLQYTQYMNDKSNYDKPKYQVPMKDILQVDEYIDQQTQQYPQQDLQIILHNTHPSYIQQQDYPIVHHEALHFSDKRERKSLQATNLRHKHNLDTNDFNNFNNDKHLLKETYQQTFQNQKSDSNQSFINSNTNSEFHSQVQHDDHSII